MRCRVDAIVRAHGISVGIDGPILKIDIEHHLYNVIQYNKCAKKKYIRLLYVTIYDILRDIIVNKLL